MTTTYHKIHLRDRAAMILLHKLVSVLRAAREALDDIGSFLRARLIEDTAGRYSAGVAS